MENLTYLLPDATAAELTAAIDTIGATALVERIGGLGRDREAGRSLRG